MTAPVQVGPSSAHDGPDPSPARHLTPRQLEVLQLAANGCTNREIGRRLCLTEEAIKSQMAVILRRLHVEDRTQAVAVGIRFGLISLDTITVSPRPERAPRGARNTDTDQVDDALAEQLADIGDRIRAERQARGWSVHRLSVYSGIPVITLKRLEAGSGSLRVFVQACAGLEVSMSYLLSEDWRMPDSKPVRSSAPGPIGLSPRQEMVLCEAASGDSLAQVGARLGLDARAVGAALSRAYQRLGVAFLPAHERRSAAVRVAVQHGLLDPPKRTS